VLTIIACGILIVILLLLLNLSLMKENPWTNNPRDKCKTVTQKQRHTSVREYGKVIEVMEYFQMKGSTEVRCECWWNVNWVKLWQFQ
jgi:hypothetical protein